MRLSEKLKSLLMEKAVSSTILAKNVKVNQTTITKILHGTTQFSTTPTLLKLAKYFNIGVNELITINNNDDFKSDISAQSVGVVLKKLMNDNNCMSINLLHEATGVSRADIRDILNHKIQNPNMDTLQKLADYFKISILQLCGKESIKAPQ